MPCANGTLMPTHSRDLILEGRSRSGSEVDCGIMLRDMSPDAQRVREQVLRRLSGPEKLAVVSDLTSLVHSLARAGIRERMPDATEDEREEAYFSLVLGAELARTVLSYRGRRRSRVAGS